MPRILFLSLLLVLSAALPAGADEGQWLMAQGQLALGAGDPARAYTIFQEGRRRFPDDARFAYLAAIAAERSGNAEEAFELLAALRSQGKTASLPTLGLDTGRILYRLGRYEEAEKELKAYASQRPDDALGFVWLGETYLAQGKDEEAFGMFNRAGKPAPELQPIYHYTRGSRIFLNNPDEATAELKQAIESGRQGPLAPLAEQLIDLAGKKSELERWYNIDIATGFQQDTNMLAHTAGDSERFSGQRVSLAGSFFARPRIGDQFFLGVGALLNQSIALEAEGRTGPAETALFDSGGYSLMLDGSYLISGEASAWEPGLEYAIRYGTLAGEAHSLTHNVYPRVTWYHGPTSAAKFYGIVQRADLNDVARVGPLDSLESGMTLGAGVAEYLVFGGRLDALTMFLEYAMHSVDDPDGTAWQGPRLGVNGRSRLVADLYAEYGVFGAYRIVDASHGGSALYSHVDAGLGYLLFNHLEVDLNLGYSRSFGNDENAYDRMLTGVYVRGLF